MKTGKRFLKKGVSPLIATVLLISFAVALGSVVLNWGRNLDVSPSDNFCSGVSIALRDLGNVEACYVDDGQNAYIHFVIDNEGAVAVEGLGIWIVGQKGTKLLDLDSFSVQPGSFSEIADNTVSYDFTTYGDIRHVQFIPKVRIQDSIDICPSKSIRVENVAVC